MGSVCRRVFALRVVQPGTRVRNRCRQMGTMWPVAGKGDTYKVYKGPPYMETWMLSSGARLYYACSGQMWVPSRGDKVERVGCRHEAAGQARRDTCNGSFAFVSADGWLVVGL